MGILLRVALLVLPIVEIAVLIAVGERIGIAATLLLVVLGFLAGAALIRSRSLVALARVREALQRGETPVAELFETACVIAAGLLLMIPGFITDLAAIALLLPAARRGLRRAIAARLGGAGRRPRAGVIDGEW